jgi:NADPH2:quinone reductase
MFDFGGPGTSGSRSFHAGFGDWTTPRYIVFHHSVGHRVAGMVNQAFVALGDKLWRLNGVGRHSRPAVQRRNCLFIPGGPSMLAIVNTPGRAVPIELREVAEPIPARDEALVEVHAFSLNRGELSSFVRNKEGWIPGQDIAGVVLRQAANGAGPPAGARVVALVDEFGWAQRAAVPSHRMAVLPETVSFSQAATLPVAGLTALRTLRHGGPLVGRRVLIIGAAGGVGTLAVQIAVRSGAHVTAVVGRPERAEGLLALGAAEVVEGIDNAQGRFALILESAGGASLAKAIQLVEAKGTVVVYGNSSTETTMIGFANFRGAPNSRVQSFSYFTSEAEERFAPDLALLVSLIADGYLKPRIGSERGWRDILQVADQLRDRRIAGKAVLRTRAD